MSAGQMFCGLLMLSAVLLAVLAVRLPGDRDWIDLLQAMGTPSVALLAAYFTWLNYQLTRAKRKDELFDRRNDFFWRFWHIVLEANSTTGNPEEENKSIDEDWRFWKAYAERINRLAVEVRFLFGQETEKFVRNVYKRDPIRIPAKSEERFKVELPAWLVEHFSPYLMLEK